MFLAAFPDSRWDVRQIVADGDLVSVRTVWTATHRGAFLGVTATGRTVTVANSDYYRMRDGRFVEHWDVPDYLSPLRFGFAAMGLLLPLGLLFGPATVPSRRPPPPCNDHASGL